VELRKAVPLHLSDGQTYYFSDTYASTPGVFDLSCHLEGNGGLWNNGSMLAANCSTSPTEEPGPTMEYKLSVFDLTACVPFLAQDPAFSYCLANPDAANITITPDGMIYQPTRAKLAPSSGRMTSMDLSEWFLLCYQVYCVPFSLRLPSPR
jgi:hypothetical protein